MTAHLARAIALRAADRSRAGFGAAALAVGAGLVAGDDDLLLTAKDRLLKLEFQIVAQIGSPAGTPAGGLSGAHPAKEGLKDVLEPAKAAEIPIAAKAAKASLGASVTETVVHGPLLAIGEDFVGLVDLFESGLCVRAAAYVRMVLTRQAAKGFLDLFLAGLAVKPQDLVIVTLGAHAPSAVPDPSGEAPGPGRSPGPGAS